MNKRIVFVLMLFLSTNILAQKLDGIFFYTGVNFGVLHMKLRGIDDVAESGSSSVGNSLVPIAPRYEMVETTSLVLPLLLVAGLNVPVLNHEDWSVGIKLQAGFGPQVNAKNAEGLQTMALDLPQFLYYRKMLGRVDCSFLAGYTFKRAGLNYSLPLLGLECLVSEGDRIRFSISPSRYQYYMYFTNGTEEPALSIREISFTWCREF